MEHKVEKIVAAGQGKRYPTRQYNICAACKRLLKQDKFVNSVLFHSQSFWFCEVSLSEILLDPLQAVFSVLC
jgi:hypothetical protein